MYLKKALYWLFLASFKHIEKMSSKFRFKINLNFFKGLNINIFFETNHLNILFSTNYNNKDFKSLINHAFPLMSFPSPYNLFIVPKFKLAPSTSLQLQFIINLSNKKIHS